MSVGHKEPNVFIILIDTTYSQECVESAMFFVVVVVVLNNAVAKSLFKTFFVTIC